AETNKLSTQSESLDKVAVASQALKTRLFTRGVIGNVYRTKLCTDKDLIKEQQNWFPLACLSADTPSGLLDFIKNSRSKVSISGSDLIHLFAYTSKNKPKLPVDTYTGILNQGIFFWNIGKKFSKELKSLINNCKPGRVSPDVLEKLRSILGNEQLRGYLNLKKSPELVKKLAEINDPILDEILAKDEALSPLLTDKDKYQFFKELPEGSWLDKALDATIDNGQFEKYILTKYPFIISKILQDATAEQLNELVGKQAEIKSFVLANDELVTKWTQAYEFDAADYLKQSLIPTSGYKFNHLPKKQYKAAAKDIDSAVLNQLVKVSDAKISNSLKLNFIKVALKKNPHIKPAAIQLPNELALNFVNNTDFTVNHKFFSLVENHFTQADFCKAVKDKAAAKLIAGGYLTENQLFTQEQLAKIWVLPEITLEHVGKKCFESLFETSEFITQLAMRNLDLLLSKIINEQGNLLPQAKSHFIDWLKSDNYTPLNTFLLRANTASLVTQNPEILTDIIDGDCDLALGLLTAAETNTQLTWLINPLMAFTSQANIQVVFAEVLSQEQNLANLSQFLASTKPEIKNLIELLAKNVPSFSLKIVEAASIEAINTHPLLYITGIKNSEFATQFSTPVIENLLQATKMVRDEIIEQILSGNLKQKSAIAKRLLASDKIKPSHEDRAVFECLWKPKLQELDIEQMVKLLAIPEAKTALLKDAITCRNLLSSEQDIFTANDEELIQHLWEEQSELAALDVNQCLKLLKLGIAKASIAILNKPGLFEVFSAEQLIELLKFKDESVSNAVLAKPVCCLKLINFIAEQSKEFEFTNQQAWLMFCHNDELRDTLYGIDKLRKQVLGFVDTLSNSKLGEQEKAAQSYILTKRIESLQKGEPAAVAKLSHIVTKILSSATQTQLDSFLSIDAEGHLEIREVVINELKTQLDEKSLTDLNQLNSIILPVILRDENLRKTIYPALEFAELVQISNKEIAQWLFNHSEGFARLEPDEVSDLLTDPQAKELLSLAVIKLGDTEKPYLIRYFEEKLAKKETTLIQLKVALKNLLAVADFRHELADKQDYAEFKQYVVTIFKAKSFEDLLKPQQLSIANSRFGSFSVKILANNNDRVSSLPVINPKPADELETKVYTL
ncbi:MAG: hypothetical protein K0S11_1680, partial [Gammaproteobacteria bacterium]|nr:hypothetical protein [Gammaproteobacteria bacterium]